MNTNIIVLQNFWLKCAKVQISRAFVALLAIGLLGSSAQAQISPDTEKTLWSQYQSAVADAAIVEPSEIHALKPLFDDTVQSTRVVTWTSRSSYKKGEPVTLGADVWVVSLSELQEAARKFPPNLDEAALKLRLAQLYGLPTQSSYDKFIVISVSRDLAKKFDVFRPTADPDVSKIWPGKDATDFPGVTAFPDCVPPTHVLWMAGLLLNSYKITPDTRGLGYPWTRLGYTYNWMPGASEYGLSEYVIRRGATVEVVDIRPTSEFFKVYTTALAPIP